jgi:hypothetical protein
VHRPLPATSAPAAISPAASAAAMRDVACKREERMVTLQRSKATRDNVMPLSMRVCQTLSIVCYI